MKRIVPVAALALLLFVSCSPAREATSSPPTTATIESPTAVLMATASAVPSLPTDSPSPPPEPTPAPLHFVDSGQRLGSARSWDVSLGDLDNDGDLDAFVANESPAEQGNAVWLNDGQGRFLLSEQNIGAGMGVDLGDLDGDGDLDTFVTSWHQASTVWLNNGGHQGGRTGIFTDSGQVLGEPDSWDVALGDLDSDGDLDAVVARSSANTVWLNEGGIQGGNPGAFSDSGQRLGSAYTAAVELGDLDADGDLDALTVGWNEPGRVWLNDGSGTLTDSGYSLSPGYIHIHGLALGDMDNDGDLDAFLAGAPNQVWLNDGTGAFSEIEQRLPGSAGDTVALGDVDGDGDLDVFLAVGDWGNSDDKVWLNEGDGRLTDSGLSLSDVFSSGVGLGDLDNDGDLDAFVSHGELGKSIGGEVPEEVWLNMRFVAETSPPISTPGPSTTPSEINTLPMPIPSLGLLDADTADQIELMSTLRGHNDRVFSVALQAGGDYLASASPDRTIRLWKLPGGQEEHIFHINEIGTDSIAFSPDGRLLASSEAIWDVGSKQAVSSIDLGIYAPVAFSPGGSILAVAYFGQPIKLWDVTSGEVLRALDDPADNTYHSIEFSPGGTLLASGGHLNGTVTLWDVETGEIVRTLAHDTLSNFHGVAFSPDGQLLASAATEGTTKLWDVASGQLVLTLTQGNGCFDVAFAPDGSILATDGCGPTVKLWDVQSGAMLRTLRHDDEVMAVAFSPDNTLLASGCYDNLVYVWGINP